ncbi:type-F conjugative transfer system mating-pair stabilization protein TraN [Vibrio europaeus]|uniref:type-F conjugative transfer system mating-pair stabilization protein TraN n=1 Tax=Vibrio europaeus TaxID=300876 RepID=UPI0023424074|nr:type-F conjugative transfer system mating-pair stabilization protein TraN [Vibrio europaeus]MDC5841108.1 type-F conjugative transfer system mating-pair stabilization protein TraN [Vibrio europaeus]
MKKALIFSLILLAFNAMANKEQSFNDTANWAKQTSKNMLTPSSIPLNVNDYCKDATCRAKVSNPDEKSLNDGNMETKAAEAFASNDIAQGISKNTNKPRPDFKNDNEMRYALIGQENAFEISHGQSNKYVNCDNGQQCLFEDTARSCYAPTLLPVPCEKVPFFTEETVPHIPKRICRYSLTNNYSMWSESRDRKEVWAGWDGKRVSVNRDQNPYYVRGTYKGIIDNGYNNKYIYWYEVCQISNGCPPGYVDRGNDCAKHTVSWPDRCTLIPECKPISQRCIEPKETRVVNGIPTTLDCWKYEVLHECDLPNTCEQYSECTEKKRECNLKQNGVCIEEKITKTCTTKNCRTVTLNCGEQSFCLDGECYDSAPKLNTEFDKSAAALAALGDAAKGLGDPPKIFTGKSMQCSKKIGGIADCCKDGGWGTDVGIASCNEEEKALGRAKEKGLTLHVGEYCAEKFLGACIRKKRSYCAYDSKLGKIIQEQGAISQLGKTLGSAESPTCDPLTPEELSQINFDHIDFSEFYPELHSRINLPDPNVIKQRIQNSVAGDSN